MKANRVIISLLILITVFSGCQQKDNSDRKLQIVEQGGKYGFLDILTNEIVIPIKYEKASNFNKEGFARVSLNNKWGYIDKKDKVIIPIKYGGIQYFNEDLAAVFLNGKWGFINKSGNITIPIEYDKVYSFSEGLAAVKLNNKWGFIDKIGDIKIPIKYDDDGYSKEFEGGICKLRLGEKHGYIDKKNNEIIPFDNYDYITQRWDDSLKIGVVSFRKNNKRGVFLNSIKGVNLTRYTDCEKFIEGLAKVRHNDKWGFIDQEGEEVISLIYDRANDFSDDLALVAINDLSKPLGFRILGKEVFDKKYGFIDKSGKTVVPLTYENAGNFSEGLAMVELNNKKGYINKNGKVVIPIELDYERAEEFSEGLALVGYGDNIGGQKGFIDKNGNLVIPLKYHNAEAFNQGLALVTMYDYDIEWNEFTKSYYQIASNDKLKKGYINKKGEVAIPLIYGYQTSSFNDDGWANVEKNGKRYSINTEGRCFCDEDYNYKGVANSYGTGFAISSEGYIATNYHVVQGAKQLSIRGIDGDFSKSYIATIVASDKRNDLAIVKIDDYKFSGKFDKIPFSINHLTSKTGQSVFALGYPLRNTMGDEVKVTDGIISSKTGYNGDIVSYQISVPVQSGNSGGPLFDNNGNLVGVINAKHTQAENASYAIKVNYLISLIESLNVNLELPQESDLKGEKLENQIEKLRKYIYIIEGR